MPSKKKLNADSHIYLLSSIHPDYRDDFAKLCELSNFPKYEYEDLRDHSKFVKKYDSEDDMDDEDIPTISKLPKRKPSRLEKPIVKEPVEEAPKRTYIGYVTDLSLVDKHVRIAAITDPLFIKEEGMSNRDYVRILEDTLPPTRNDKLRLLNKSLPSHQLELPTHHTRYDTEIRYFIPTDDLDYGAYPEYSFIASVYYAANKQALENPIDFIKKIGKYRTYGNIVSDLKYGANVPPYTIILCRFIEGINFGEPNPNAVNEGNLSFIVVDKYVFLLYANYNKHKMLINQYIFYKEKQPISIKEFTEKFHDNYSNKVSASIAATNKIIRHLEAQLSLHNAKLGEQLFTQKAVIKHSKNVLDALTNNIVKIPDIASFELISTGFSFITRDLYIEYKGNKFYCGVFKVICKIFEKKSITYCNMAAPNVEHHNPHGDCTGTFSLAINSCLKEQDYFSFVLTLIAMLKTLNPDDSNAMENFELYFNKTEKPKETFMANGVITIYSSDNELGDINLRPDDDDTNNDDEG